MPKAKQVVNRQSADTQNKAIINLESVAMSHFHRLMVLGEKKYPPTSLPLDVKIEMGKCERVGVKESKLKSVLEVAWKRAEKSFHEA